MMLRDVPAQLVSVTSALWIPNDWCVIYMLTQLRGEETKDAAGETWLHCNLYENLQNQADLKYECNLEYL